jgi:hypothetical protein
MFTRNLSWLLPSIILVSMVWLGGFCAASMDHGSVIHSDYAMTAISGVDCTQSASASTCASVHMGILQEVAYAIPGNMDFGLGIASLISLVVFVALCSREREEGVRALHRVRYRERFEKIVHSFHTQLLGWISSVKNTDCAYCLA